ncbi:MAG: hypothetical protein NUV98_01120, partial [Candidatus Roizmanbacteria bacterium]|nr:hypothetical protein [Candidatus Roizmanbacteria bacterium]
MQRRTWIMVIAAALLLMLWPIGNKAFAQEGSSLFLPALQVTLTEDEEFVISETFSVSGQEVTAASSSPCFVTIQFVTYLSGNVRLFLEVGENCSPVSG